jgi:hypothetical protein
MPTRAKKHAKASNDVRKTPASAKGPAKPEDPVAAFLARLGSAKKGGEALNPAQRREIARRAARMSSISEAKTPERDTKKR